MAVSADLTTLPPLKVALAGPPNCGKTALFNALTGSRQKVANYPGVTVERKEGTLLAPSGLRIQILDLPGTYSLTPRTLDEQITRDVLQGEYESERPPEAIVAVADATNLERNLGLVLELKSLGKPVVLALNMMDLAESRGLDLDLAVLSRELQIPVIPTIATKKKGMDQLIRAVSAAGSLVSSRDLNDPLSVRARFKEVDRILSHATRRAPRPIIWSNRIDRIVTHPIAGPVVLLLILSIIFQAVFSWAKIPQDWIQKGIDLLGTSLAGLLGEGAFKSLLVDGVLAGVGAVLVFVPQIAALFFFILVLEDSGYMSRAAFLMDRIMGRVGLHGRAFIPLLSSFACAIPGIMATRTIESRRDRLITILVSPLMTCSARLPVYTLLIAAFIPDKKIWGPFALPGLVMLALYGIGVLTALGVALFLKRTTLRGSTPPLLLELPTYKIPALRNLAQGLVERVRLFTKKAGTVILSISILLWFLSSFPRAPQGATQPAIHYSFAGKIGHALEPVIRPIGFNWQIGVAMVPGFAAREVMVGALGTVYAVESKQKGSEDTASLKQKLASSWSVATALSLLAWYIFAPQCLSTIAVTRRETNSWRWPGFMLVYLTLLAYSASFLVYHVARVFERIPK